LELDKEIFFIPLPMTLVKFPLLQELDENITSTMGKWK
jgi:hypothetical protein